MNYRVATHTSQGGREYNEDSLAVEKRPGGLFCVVADGLGMHGGGDVASGLVTNTLVRCCKDSFTLDKATFSGYLEQANRAILEKQTPTCRMKSTVVALLCEGDRATVAHLGDSRCYYFKNGSVALQTVDHSVSQMAVIRGEITPAQIRFHEDRNRLLRALGGAEGVHPDVVSIPGLEPQDAFLLCSDGFWEYVTEAEMELDLLKSSDPGQWLSLLLTRIGKRVDGKNDNLTAVAVLCGGD